MPHWLNFKNTKIETNYYMYAILNIHIHNSHCVLKKYQYYKLIILRC